MIACQNENIENNSEVKDNEEFSVMEFIKQYLLLIENENFDQINNFLICFSKQLDHYAFSVIEKEEEDFFFHFSEIFCAQLAIQTNKNILFQYLHTFHKLQTLFRSISFNTFNSQNIQNLLNFFDIESIQIRNELILIFIQYLPVNYNIFHILMDKAFFLIQSGDETIRHSLLNLINGYLIERPHPLSDSELQNIEQILISLLEKDQIDSITLQKLASILKSIWNKSLTAFLSQLDLTMVNFFENLLIKSLSIPDGYSQVALRDCLDSILFLTSNRIPRLFSRNVNILFENFDILVFTEIIRNCQNLNAILSVQCICNFILGGFSERILSSNEIINCFLEQLEIGEFEIKQEIILCFTNLIDVSPINYKSTFLSNRKISFLFSDVLPTLDKLYALNILKNLLNALTQCSKISDFGRIKKAFLESEFLRVFELIDCTEEDEIITEINQISELFLKILS